MITTTVLCTMSTLPEVAGRTRKAPGTCRPPGAAAPANAQNNQVLPRGIGIDMRKGCKDMYMYTGVHLHHKTHSCLRPGPEVPLLWLGGPLIHQFIQVGALLLPQRQGGAPLGHLVHVHLTYHHGWLMARGGQHLVGRQQQRGACDVGVGGWMGGWGLGGGGQ